MEGNYNPCARLAHVLIVTVTKAGYRIDLD